MVLSHTSGIVRFFLLFVWAAVSGAFSFPFFLDRGVAVSYLRAHTHFHT